MQVLKDIICIDETAIWESMERSVARSESGKEALSHKTCYKGKKHTVIEAMSVDGIEQVGTLSGAKPAYLPTYFPDFNPIEMLWSVLKHFMRLLRPQSLNPFLNIFPLLSEKSFFKNWFNKCCCYTA